MTEYIVLFRMPQCSRWTLAAALRAAGWTSINHLVYYCRTAHSRSTIALQLAEICAALEVGDRAQKPFTLVSVTEHIRAARRENIRSRVA